MIRTTIILLFGSLAWTACDTTAKQNTVTAEPVVARAYISPAILSEQAAVATLPADTIPVSYSTKGVAQAPTEFAPMMGQWESTMDPGEMVHFLPGKYISYYEGNKVVEENMTYFDVCPNSCTNGVGPAQPCFVVASPYNQMCFTIVQHTDQQLQLSLLGSNGGIMTYQRKTNN
jgi:hypothetical protein